MIQNAYVVTGTLTDEKTIALDEPLHLGEKKVEVIVKAVSTPAKRPYMEVMQEIRARQRARGHVPRTREEVDAELKAERDSWDE